MYEDQAPVVEDTPEPIQLAQAASASPIAQAPMAAPSGAPAAPAPQPGLGAVPQRAAPVTPTPQKTDPISNMMNFFRDPKRLAVAGAAAAAAERPDVLMWLKRGHEAQKENTGEALAKLIAGDKQGAIDAFNMSGDMQAESIEDGAKPGHYKVTLKGGFSREIDPKKELHSLLTPPQMIQAMDRSEALDVRRDLGGQLIESRNMATEARRAAAAEREARMRSEFDAKQADRDAQRARDMAAAAASYARADRTRAGDSGELSPKEQAKQLRQKLNGIPRAVNDLKKIDPNTKEEVGPDAVERMKLKALVEALLKKDPELDVNQAAERVFSDMQARAADAKAKVDKEEADMKKSAPWYSIGDPVKNATGKSAKAWREERMKQLENGEAAPPTAPFAENARIRNKKDNKWYIVKNGVPVLDPNQ